MNENTDDLIDGAEREGERRGQNGIATPLEADGGDGECVAGLDGADAVMEQARTDAGADGPPEEAAVGDSAPEGVGPGTEETTRILVFRLGDELVCVDSADLETILTPPRVTPTPNTPACVEGVVAVRGQIRTILDARRLLGIETEGAGEVIVLFGPEAVPEFGAVGWIVDAVRQVRPVATDRVLAPPDTEAGVEGVIDPPDIDDLLVWVDPERTIAAALAEDDD